MNVRGLEASSDDSDDSDDEINAAMGLTPDAKSKLEQEVSLGTVSIDLSAVFGDDVWEGQELRRSWALRCAILEHRSPFLFC